MTSQYNRYCKCKFCIHHLFRTILKISSSVTSSGTPSVCPAVLTLRYTVNYLLLFCIGTKVGKFLKNKQTASNNLHIMKYFYVFTHLNICLWISIQIRKTNYINLNNNFHGLVRFLPMKNFFFGNVRDYSLSVNC